MANAIDYDKVDAMAAQFTDYARTLHNSERIRLAAQVIGLANAVQQHADITQTTCGMHGRLLRCLTM